MLLYAIIFWIITLPLVFLFTKLYDKRKERNAYDNYKKQILKDNEKYINFLNTVGGSIVTNTFHVEYSANEGSKTLYLGLPYYDDKQLIEFLKRDNAYDVLISLYKISLIPNAYGMSKKIVIGTEVYYIIDCVRIDFPLSSDSSQLKLLEKYNWDYEWYKEQLKKIRSNIDKC